MSEIALFHVQDKPTTVRVHTIYPGTLHGRNESNEIQLEVPHVCIRVFCNYTPDNNYVLT